LKEVRTGEMTIGQMVYVLRLQNGENMAEFGRQVFGLKKKKYYVTSHGVSLAFSEGVFELEEFLSVDFWRLPCHLNIIPFDEL